MTRRWLATLALGAVVGVAGTVGVEWANQPDPTVHCEAVYVALDQDPNSPTTICSRSPIEFR